MGYIFTLGDMLKYTEWSRQPNAGKLLAAGMDLCCQMLAPQPLEEILDIGSGSCYSLLKLRHKGLMARGIEASPDIVGLMRRKHDLHDCLDTGEACDLPYEDNSFSYACFFNSLEYIDDPRGALAEAFRVTRQKVFIGFFNRYAAAYYRHRIQSLRNRSFANKANFFTLWEIKNMVYGLLGPVPLKWQTITTTPFYNMQNDLYPLKYMPLGAFIGVTVTVNPRFTTNALHLKHECPSGA